MLKDVRPAELVHAVCAIHSCDTLLAPAITRVLSKLGLRDRVQAVVLASRTPGSGSRVPVVN